MAFTWQPRQNLKWEFRLSAREWSLVVGVVFGTEAFQTRVSVGPLHITSWVLLKPGRVFP